MAAKKMLAKAYAISLMGLAGTVVEVESEISSTLPGFVLVGLPDASLSESKDRVRAAIQNSGLKMPDRRVTVNLSPASVRKQGSSFDLAIAVSVMAAAGQLNASSVSDWVHLGELGLDGSVRRVTGILPALLVAKAAGKKAAIVPRENFAEASLVDGITVVSVEHFRQVAKMHGSTAIGDIDESGENLPAPEPNSNSNNLDSFVNLDIADVLGQDDAIEALVVAAAGGHHLLMVGPPGAGKTMMAERIPSLLPDLKIDQALETTAVVSVAGNRRITEGSLLLRPPFEAPHHTASVSSLVGGGLGAPRPGLISLANNGVLFLDEAPEFMKPVLEALRQPLESGEVVINRSAGTAKFPARFQLVLAANPCPCGNAIGTAKSCRCSEQQKSKYLAKLSGPLLDRVDIRLQIQAVSPAQMAIARSRANSENGGARSSAAMRDLVSTARQRAESRLANTPWRTNSQVPGSYLRKHFPLSASVGARLEKALDQGRISMRGYDRCLRVAWSVADLAGRDMPNEFDIAKAIFLRGSDDLLGIHHG
jgi:magnesium chelatase family protein